ncbi:hypothetical protein HYW54_04050 [Candidatus Gottesmanbacteria bacterium]|nr:hypothetical protein [Candidatus Gottesmanbacteria bacterium]
MNNRITTLILLLFITISLSISLLPDIFRIISTPANTIFPLIHNNASDYFYYLSLIRQGYDGNLLLTSRMTPEQFHPAFTQTIFSIMGLVSRLFSLSLPLTYLLARIVFGLFLLFTIIYCAKILFRKNIYVVSASFLAIFTTGFWIIGENYTGLPVRQYLIHWTRLDPIIRTTYLPHHLASTVIGLFSLIILSKSLDQKNIKMGVLAAILALLSSFIYFATMVNILGGLTLVVLLTIRSLTYQNLKDKLPIVCIYILLSSLPLFYFRSLSLTSFPWSAYDKVGENFNFYLPFLHYLYSSGLVFPLTLVGLPLIFKTKEFLPKFLLGWALFPFIGLFVVAKIFPQYGNVYYLEATSHIPFGLLSLYGFIYIKNRFYLHKKVLLLIFILLGLYFIPPTLTSIVYESGRLKTNYYNFFIPEDIFKGFSWLDGNTPSESIILAGGYFGNVVPAFTHNRVVYGHRANTYKPEEKKAALDIFFNQTDLTQSAKILKKFNVSYIFFSLDTNNPIPQFETSLPVIKVYQNPSVSIYKVTTPQ